MRPAAWEMDKADESEYERILEDKDSVFWNVHRKARELGYNLTSVPEELGGEELPPRATAMHTLELGWGSVGLATSLGVDAFPAFFIQMAQGLGKDTEKLEEEILKPWIHDEDLEYLGCWAVTEPEHGSDFIMAETPVSRDPEICADKTAEKDGNEWIINGSTSQWVSNGCIANLAALHVSVDPSKGMAGGGLCIVPMDLEGASTGEPLRKMGQRGNPQGELIFDHVRIPEDYMVVGPDWYDAIVSQILCISSSGMGAYGAALARAAFEEALKYSKERVQGGKPIVEHQKTKGRLVEMWKKAKATQLYARRALEYYGEKSQKGEIIPNVSFPVTAQTFCTQMGYEVAHEALQLHGGYGLTEDYLVEKLFRDARSTLIEDGCNEILDLKASYNIIENYPW